jgi:hypothetical protein
MSDVTIPRQRLRELEICAELGANMVIALDEGKGDLMAILIGLQAALSRYEALMALEKARIK